ncbi:PAS domain-containing sensor histidine kinase [Paenibacillus sp. KS1]|uniref:PAS domain S-box protein n=1 Tax=Paenibacillus sp. KS1 TaxID=1849249 RepID=UPI0008067147|nr:PAS domain S-box protein [Paenibacillus sp. KS1]OBY78179.1 PAS domain-containing sensor histidine kinase [Paenibacillus sp. KS1]
MHLEQIDMFDLAFNNASIGMAIVSLEGRFMKANHALCDMIGYTECELLSLDYQHITHPDDLEESILHIQQLLDRQISSFHIEKRYIGKLGEVIWMLLTVSLVLDKSGKPLFFFSQFQNITVCKQSERVHLQTEAILKEKEDSFQSLLEMLPLAVIVTHNGIIHYMNRASINLICADEAAGILGKPVLDIVEPTNHNLVYERRRKYREGIKLGPVKYDIRCANGEMKRVEGFSLPTTFHGEKATIGVYQDITDRSKEEERMLQSEKLSIVGQLAAGIAHEIRNPLTSINGFLKLMRTMKTDKEQYFDIVESELKSIEVIANELLILAKPNVVNSRRTDLIHLMEQIIAFMSVQSTLKNSNIVTDLSEEALWVDCEPNQIKQVFINLIKNAIEAMSGGGNIYVRAKLEGDYAAISIQDEGCGIPADKVSRLGQPFYTTKDTGTGLGLMVSYNIIDKHGGSIEVDSVIGVGTTFIIRLPLVQVKEGEDAL